MLPYERKTWHNGDVFAASTTAPDTAAQRLAQLPGAGARRSRLPDPHTKHWLVRIIFSQAPWSVFGAIGMAISFLCNGFIPVLLGRAIDQAIATGDLTQLIRWVAMIIAVGLLGLATQYAGMFFALRSEMLIAHDLRMQLTQRILDPRGFATQTTSPGELLAVASTDVNRVARCVIMTVFPVAEISSIIYVMVMLWFIHPGLSLALILGVPFLIGLATVAAQPLRRRSLSRQQEIGKTATKATDYLQGLRVLKGLAAVRPAQHRYRTQSARAYQATVRASGAEATLLAVTQLAGLLFVSALTLAAGLLAVSGTITVGQFIATVGLAQFIVTPVTMFGRNIATVWANAAASAQRIIELLTAPYNQQPPLDDATFARLRTVLAPGFHVVTAEECASTKALAHLAHPDFLLAPHTPALFSGTVGENIVGDPDTARWALHAAQGADIPGGINREVGESGTNLSGGQRQRVALARAIAAQAEILILQDPITAVDALTATRIVENLTKLRQHQTTVVISPAQVWQQQADHCWSAEAFTQQLQPAVQEQS